MKARAQELKAEARANKNKADGESAVLAAISAMPEPDRGMAKRLHEIVGVWWLATAEEELIRDCMIDRNRYAIIGMSVMGTWLFATFAWTYFFSTVTPNLPIACFLGFFMGCIILSIDRALIKGITRSNKRKFIPLVFRGLLAVTIGVFMAQPALLYLFDKEIHVQTSLDNEHRKKEKRMRQDSVYQASRADLLRSKNELEQQLSTKYGEVSQARQIFIAETDGTGGSKRPGLKDVAKAKQDEYYSFGHGRDSQPLAPSFRAICLKKDQHSSLKIASIDAAQRRGAFLISALKKSSNSFLKVSSCGLKPMSIPVPPGGTLPVPLL